MKMQSAENFFWEAKVIVYLTVPAILLLVFWKACNRAEKSYSVKCHKERPMAFEGVITNYKTDVLAEKSTFNLNDSISMTIPRNSKEMYLNDHDTIMKVKDTNLYIVKRSTLWTGQERKKIDTFNFNCPSIEP